MKPILKFASYVAVFVLGAIAAIGWHLHTDTNRYYLVQYHKGLSLPSITEKVDRESCEQLRTSIDKLSEGLFSDETRPSVCVPLDQGKLMQLQFAEQDRQRAARQGKKQVP